MSIWFKNNSVENIKLKDTLIESLGIEITETGDNYIVGTMPVDNRCLLYTSPSPRDS